MKFKKLLAYNVNKSTALNPQSWRKIESLTDKIVFVSKDSPQLNKELKDTDGILVAFGTVIGKIEIDAAPFLKFKRL
jgi:hypothetical protein